MSSIANINNVNESYHTLYNYNGVGYLSCFELAFGSPDVLIRFEVDGEEIFEIDGELFYDNLREFDGISRELLMTNQNFFIFKPKASVAFKENFKIQIKSNDTSNWKDFDFGYVMVEEV